MAQVNSATQSVTPAPSGALRIVLFGMPDAGKSSLLGALTQAAQTQEHVLNGHLIDKSQRLLELQRRLYEDRPRETLEEVVSFDVSLEPFTGKPGQPAPETVHAALIDCDGRVANELLGQQDLQGNKRALTRAVLDADTLVLVVDASTDINVLKRDFGQFAKFLRSLEQTRGQRTEVGGLPVYLILTKCDLLAQKTDTTVAWIDRIEERKRQVDRRFQEFLAQQADREKMQFGKIDLHLWATAVKRPALADTPARPRDPYGVAELFRQCLESAAVYRQRRTQAGKRLLVALAAILGVVAAMVLLMLVLVLSQPSAEATALNDEVRRYLSIADKKADLYRNVSDKLIQLHKIKESPDFSRLSQENKERINADLKELTAYQEYARQVNEVGSDFGDDLNRLLNESKLKEIREKLQKLTPPEDYQAAWDKSPVGKRRLDWLHDLDVLDRERRRLVSAYEQLPRDGEVALKKIRDGLQTVPLPKLVPLAKAVLDRARQLPDLSDKGAAQELLPGAIEVRYSTLFFLPSVRTAYDAWANSSTKKKLQEKVDQDL